LSGLLKKRILVDRSLGVIIGAQEGATVSYAEIQKGLHKYIRDSHLRTDLPGGATAAPRQTLESEKPETQARGSFCIFCGEAIPSGAKFCDLCGVLQ